MEWFSRAFLQEAFIRLAQQQQLNELVRQLISFSSSSSPPILSQTDTTRSPRPGEEPGVSYHYVTRPEFLELVSKGAFLEHAEFGKNLYGTTAQAVADVSQGEVETPQGKVRRRALLDIDAEVSRSF